MQKLTQNAWFNQTARCQGMEVSNVTSFNPQESIRNKASLKTLHNFTAT